MKVLDRQYSDVLNIQRTRGDGSVEPRAKTNPTEHPAAGASAFSAIIEASAARAACSAGRAAGAATASAAKVPVASPVSFILRSKCENKEYGWKRVTVKDTG